MFGLYRRAGANLPRTDPAGYHGVALEGWFWRFVQPQDRAVVVAIAAVCRDAGGRRWGMAALAARTPGFSAVRWRTHDDVITDPGSADVRIGGLLTSDPHRLRVRLGEGFSLDARLDDRRGWNGALLGGMGPAQLVPGLSQYWHPHLLAADATGVAHLGGVAVRLDGASAYAEKNWGGGGMPRRWWWGQAHVGDDRVCVAFAGGPAGVGPLRVDGTSLVVGRDRWVAPLQPLRVEVSEGRWSIVGRGLSGTHVEVEGHADEGSVVPLPIPLPRERRVLDRRSPQHLAGSLRVEVRRRGRVQLAEETSVAGLELGRG